LTPSEERDFNTLLLELGAALGTQVQLSHLLRAAIELIKHARSEVLDEARQTPGPAPAGERLPHRHGDVRAAARAHTASRLPEHHPYDMSPCGIGAARPPEAGGGTGGLAQRAVT
jgi:hypothetical protein